MAGSDCILRFAGVTSAVMNVGRVGRLWRYPVKSMRGEACREAGLGARGVEGGDDGPGIQRVGRTGALPGPSGIPWMKSW